MTAVVHRRADAAAMPWRNGGGVTHELVRRPVDGDFDWRLSVAEVAEDGPFSSFDGYERVLVLLSGAGMDLHVATGDGTADLVALRPPFAMHRFPGEARIEATLPAGPTTDLNLMWRRDRLDVTVRRMDAPFDLAARSGATLLAFVADGAPVVGDGVALRAGDVAECDDILHVDGTGTLFVFGLVPR